MNWQRKSLMKSKEASSSVASSSASRSRLGGKKGRSCQRT